MGTFTYTQSAVYSLFMLVRETVIAYLLFKLTKLEQGGHVRRKIACLWKEPRAPEGYETAVSLHGHTNCSKESLHFIADFADKFGLLQWFLSLKERKAMRDSRIRFDFDRAYWTPPLTPNAAYELEFDQINEKLALNGIVSLTDHDNIQAALSLRVHQDEAAVPISIEWSVPYGGDELHIGLHNLPAGDAPAIVARMNEYTGDPREYILREILAELNARPDVLIVLNHPLWDIAGAGSDLHCEAVNSFMGKLGQHIHAFELGGLRSWEENRAVYDLAAEWNVAVIGGGDRHGCEPSACLNLTHAASFPEFISEVRTHKRTNVLFMPQYARPLWERMLQVVLDATAHQPHNPAGAHWDARTFHPDPKGNLRPLSELWRRRPAFIEVIFGVFRLLESGAIRQAIASHVKRRQQMQFLLGHEEA